MTERVCGWSQELMTQLLCDSSWATREMQVMMPPYLEERPDPEAMMRQRTERMFEDVRRINNQYIAEKVLSKSSTFPIHPDFDKW